MKTLIAALALTLLQGCSVLTAVGGALGIGATDLAPSLKMCQEVEYKRSGIDAEIRAKCRVPAG